TQEKLRLQCTYVCRSQSCPLSTHKFRKPLRSQLASRTGSASIAPTVALRPVAHITAMPVLDDEIKERLASDLLRHGERIGLIDPHERSMNGDAFVEAQG